MEYKLLVNEDDTLNDPELWKVRSLLYFWAVLCPALSLQHSRMKLVRVFVS
jgi:hypothetical protein